MSKSTDKFLETNESEEATSGYDFTFNAGYNKEFTICDDEPSINKGHLVNNYIKEMLYNFVQKGNTEPIHNSDNKKLA